MTQTSLFSRAIDPAVRANPYPLYARLLETPVARQDDGVYVVSAYEEVRTLLFDSRMSSEVVPKPTLAKTGNPFMDWILNPVRTHFLHKHRSFVLRDPPDHDVVRRHVMAQFTQERLQNIKPHIAEVVDALISEMQGRGQVDLIADFAYPLPVAVICQLLGVPPEDEKKFQAWSTGLASGGDLLHLSDEANQKIAADVFAISSYLGGLIDTPSESVRRTIS
jgi:cytochrome P450